PDYGLGAGDQPQLERIASAKFGAVERNTGVAPPDLLAIIASTAAPVTVPDWKRQAEIKVSSAGLSELTLTPAVMSLARPDLNDIRIVSGAVQIPYVFGEPRRIETVVTPVAETKNGVTVFKVEFPYANVPMKTLAFRTGETVAFSRAVRLYSSARDRRGAVSRAMLESRVWNYNPEEMNCQLVFSLPGQSSGEPFFMEIDNGSNGPVSITSAAVVYELAALIFRAEPGALSLLYSNSHAAAPQYDMQMFRDRLLNADTNPAELSGADSAVAAALLSRSEKVLLGLLLAAVAAGLAWAVARALPKERPKGGAA
ncbi:MAG: hypothetical protein PHW69_08525, partial [Elusimicrobiaceae bacterium]|nr:hypothetical protein [Elusimicrobiaceae bacterium]